MPILNYTTDVAASKSVAQVIGLLSRKGAQSITQEFFEDGRVKAISFVMRVGIFPVRFELPANTSGVAGVLKKGKPYKPSYARMSRDQYAAKQMIQAEMIAWRIVKDWVEAQMAMIESGQADPAQIFMPYATEPNSGQTIYSLWVATKQKQLPESTQGDRDGGRI